MNNSLMRRPSYPLTFGEDSIISPFLPISENPLSVLARTDPPAATSLMHRAFDFKEIELTTQRSLARMDLLRGISTDQTSQIISFIQSNAGKGHVSSSVETCGTATNNAFLFPSGQRVHMRTTFKGVAY